jgi:hypothetical protein
MAEKAGAHDIGPRLSCTCEFPRKPLTGNSVNRGNTPLLDPTPLIQMCCLAVIDVLSGTSPSTFEVASIAATS